MRHARHPCADGGPRHRSTFLLRLFSDRTDWQQVGGSRMVEAKITRQVESAVEGVLDAQSVADGKAYLTRLRLVAERLEYEA